MTAGCALAVALLLPFHSFVPDLPGNPGSFVETFLPWLGTALPPLLVLAVLIRSATALSAVLAAGAVWAACFGPYLLPRAPTGYDLTVVQHNVSDENGDPSATARALAAAGPDLIAVEELTRPALPAYEDVLRGSHPHHTIVGTVGLWSRYPITGTGAADIRPEGIDGDWNRGLRATVRVAQGRDIAVYVVHLPSVRMRPATGFDARRRDESAALLGKELATERAPAVILMGDLNGTTADRGLSPVTSRLSGRGGAFAFSWPAAFPVAGIDQVLGRGASVTEVWTLPATGSDHLPVAARVRLAPSH
ncbi:endonuclease/exonuclease/phosphatase family protein [Streptomyces sp. GC420]|uniref:endonuclease/exonuclease/phosphatase family protein n=1 Tax=Streptomyces sp. GC420 TaxID=2697568 RepID=UPI001414FD8A|nr:endonuclease/exonuclease/phosphatase family protein [Streptomyces sp. GC420]NBM16028.1 endonuclease/exonuclease/phosphatase family protein [Streptomyces sp. GC420]